MQVGAKGKPGQSDQTLRCMTLNLTETFPVALRMNGKIGSFCAFICVSGRKQKLCDHKVILT